MPINQILAYNVSNRFFNLFFWGFFYVALCSIFNPENIDFFRSFPIFLKISPYINLKKNAQNTPTAVEGRWTETHVLGKIHLPHERFWTLQKCPKSMTPPSNIAKYVIASPCLNKFNHTFENNFTIFVTGPSQNRPKHIDSIVS